jgi:tetratricopeptide (TPR) repeat protein
MFWRLNLAFLGHPNVLSVEVQIFTERMEEEEDISVREENREMERLKKNGINIKATTGFLFCPHCGLRRPKEKGIKYCPNCSCKLIEEGPLPYSTRSYSIMEIIVKNKVKERRIMERVDSIFSLVQQNESRKNKNELSYISAVEKADNGDYQKAIDEFSELIRLNPKDANSYFARATLKVRIGDIEGARLDFEMSEMCHRTSNITSQNYPVV